MALGTVQLQVLEKVLGRKPYFVRVGGTIPAAALIQSTLGIDVTMFAFGCEIPHSRNHRIISQSVPVHA